MYRVVIVDDEEIMRDGLINLVDWESMGFKVVAQFEDGQETIEYIKANPVDVVLTDIKMTFVSGLDLAKYVNEEKLPVKVVLISGYKDFEYARQAVDYNVVQYLLKPISLGDIKRVFTELKRELDSESEWRRQQENSKQHYNELLSLLRDQFFTDLVLGALRSKKEIERHIRLLNLDIDIEKNMCCNVTINVLNYRDYLTKCWSYGEEDLYTAIRNFLFGLKQSVQYFPISNRDGKISVLAVCKQKTTKACFEGMVKEQLDSFRQNISKVMGMEVTVDMGRFFNSIHELAVHTSPVRPLTSNQHGASQDHRQVIKPEDLERLNDQQKLMMTHISNGNSESVVSLYEQLLEELRPMGIRMVQNFVVDIFAMIVNKLKEIGIEAYGTSQGCFNYSDILKLQNVDQILDWGRKNLERMTEKAVSQGTASQRNVIRRIKQYIMENYNRDITLEEVADHVFLSPVYLSRLFKEQTGENFIDYLIGIRMKKAVELLANPRYKVYEVSQMVGYSSIKYFYRLFKKYKGCTPTEYRKKLKV